MNKEDVNADARIKSPKGPDAGRKRPFTRLRITTGHLKGIMRMIEEDRHCTEILRQIAAVQASLSRLANVLIKEYLEECIREIIGEGPEAREPTGTAGKKLKTKEGETKELMEALVLFKGMRSMTPAGRKRG